MISSFTNYLEELVFFLFSKELFNNLEFKSFIIKQFTILNYRKFTNLNYIQNKKEIIK
jgi:hypothetical protein